MNSKGFRMRRDREAKQELNITTNKGHREAKPERPLSEQKAPSQEEDAERSLIGRLWRAIRS